MNDLRKGGFSKNARKKLGEIAGKPARTVFYIRLPVTLARTVRDDSKRNGKPVNGLLSALITAHCSQDSAIRDLAYIRVPKQTRGRRTL